jgi:hypothetical protein
MAARLWARSAALVGIALVAGAVAATPAHAAATRVPGCVTPSPLDPRMGHSSPTAVLGALGHAPGGPAPVGGTPAAYLQ